MEMHIWYIFFHVIMQVLIHRITEKYLGGWYFKHTVCMF